MRDCKWVARPLAMTLVAILSGCAAPPPVERAARFQPTDIKGFMLDSLGRPNEQGAHLYTAAFNDVNSYQLYQPMRELQAFCSAKGASFRAEGGNNANAILGTPLPRVTSINGIEERLTDRKRLLATYQAAVAKGAFGRYACVTQDQRTLWWASVTPGSFTPEDPNNLLNTNKLQLIVETRIN